MERVSGEPKEQRSRVTIEEQIREWERQAGASLCVSPPSECQQLWDLARMHGVRVGRLFVLRHPLKVGRRGSWHRETGDLWIWHQGLAHLSRTLVTELHELAHVVRNTPYCADIEAYWEEEYATYERASMLAQEWGVPQMLSREMLEGYLADVERFSLISSGIAALIGSRETTLVLVAEEQVRSLRAQWGQDLDGFGRAVNGWGDSEEQFERLVDLDRSCLRSGWRGIPCASGSLGRLALPRGGASARVLHALLRQMAERGGAPDGQAAVAHQLGERVCQFLFVEDQSALPRAVQLAQEMLLQFPEAMARAVWTVYGDEAQVGAARVYRLGLDFEFAELGIGASKTQHLREVWVLFGFTRREDLLAEAAWQRYILSWQKGVQIRVEPLKEGLLFLWNILGAETLAGRENELE
jgi:hypothetical protein